MYQMQNLYTPGVLDCLLARDNIAKTLNSIHIYIRIHKCIYFLFCLWIYN